MKKHSLDILNHFIFNNTTFKVGIIWEDGEPLFRALDVGKVLDIKKIRSTIKDFDNDEKVTRIMGSLGGNQETMMLTEIGLYRLIFNSRKPIAKPFQKWVANIVKEVQRKGQYKIKELQKELQKAKQKNIESIRNAEHKALLKAYDKKYVVYFARIREIDGRTLVKIGATKDIITSFTIRHPKDYGNILVFHVIESKTNRIFEEFLLKHKDIKKFIYRHPVKIGGGTSYEVISVTEDELNKVICVANRNARTYPGASPNIDDKLEKIESKLEGIVNHINGTNLYIEDESDIVEESYVEQSDHEDSNVSDDEASDHEESKVSDDEESDHEESKVSDDEESDHEDECKVSHESDDAECDHSHNEESDDEKRMRVKGTGKCLDCNVKIEYRSQRCKPCNGKRVKLINISKHTVANDSINKTEKQVSTTTSKPKRKRKPRKREKGTGKCSDCDVPISRRAQKCVGCVKRVTKFDVTKDELYDLVWTQKLPYTTIAKKYGVSDNSIRKRCISFGIEVRRPGQ